MIKTIIGLLFCFFSENDNEDDNENDNENDNNNDSDNDNKKYLIS